jgi:hypothetical protein
VQAIRKIKAGTVTTSGPSIRLTLNRVPPHSAYHDRPPNPVLEDQPTDFTLKDSGLIPVNITRLKREIAVVVNTTDERTALGDMHYALEISVRPGQRLTRGQLAQASEGVTRGTASRGGTQASTAVQVPLTDDDLEDTIDIEISLEHAADFFGPREVNNKTYYNGHWCTNSLSKKWQILVMVYASQDAAPRIGWARMSAEFSLSERPQAAEQARGAAAAADANVERVEGGGSTCKGFFRLGF